MLGKPFKVFLLAEPSFRTAMDSHCHKLRSREMGKGMSPGEEVRMWDLAKEEMRVVKLREESLPIAERLRDETMKHIMKPNGAILRDVEMVDNLVERLRLQLQKHEWLAYNLNRGVDDISDEQKDWLREKEAQLQQRLDRAKALNFTKEEYNAVEFLIDLMYQERYAAEDAEVAAAAAAAADQVNI